jgi:Na+/H+-dicarboxylate symporter
VLIEKQKQNHLGRYVFFALILGLIVGQLTRMFIHDPALLKSIAEYINMVTGLFIRLIQMIIAPIVFSILVVGIAKLSDIQSLGRLFLKSMIVFLVGSVISLTIGLTVVDFFEPGRQLGKSLLANQALIKTSIPTSFTTGLNLKHFLEQMIPFSIANSFANNNIIQIVVFSIFFGIAGVAIGKPVAPVFDFFELVSRLMFKVTDYVMMFAPIAVFCAISSIVINSGFGIISSYLVYLLEFILSVAILWITMIGIGYLILGTRVFNLIKALADSLGIAFSTTSSEAVLPNVLEELDKFGVQPKISGFAIPLGYSFNLIASLLNCIFAVMFIIQAYGYHLTIWEKIMVCLVLMMTSKGIAGVPRASLVIVAATLTTLGIPQAAIIILFPIDSFFDMIRTATNVFANALSATIVDKWENQVNFK